MTRSVPRVGLTTYVVQAKWGVWDNRTALLPTTYVDVVVGAGGLPVLLPPIVPGSMDEAAGRALEGIDALVLTGGADVDPARYGAEPHEHTDEPRHDRDEWELALLRGALDVGLPVLAVCRGAQVLNVALGGTLHQHLPDVIGDTTHRPRRGTFAEVTVSVDDGSRLAGIVGATTVVQCHHHQAIDRVGDGLVVTARAPDGTVEAVEVDGPGFALGVQWHPEQSGDERLFAALVEAAASS